jgi:hypothetical protein
MNSQSPGVPVDNCCLSLTASESVYGTSAMTQKVVMVSMVSIVEGVMAGETESLSERKVVVGIVVVVGNAVVGVDDCNTIGVIKVRLSKEGEAVVELEVGQKVPGSVEVLMAVGDGADMFVGVKNVGLIDAGNAESMDDGDGDGLVDIGNADDAESIAIKPASVKLEGNVSLISKGDIVGAGDKPGLLDG